MTYFEQKIQENDFALSSYDYTLPSSAIAQNPANPRESAKLLIYQRENERIIHSDFYHFCDFVPQDTLVVFNDTRVIKARIYAHKLDYTTQKPSDKIFEIFYHKPLPSTSVPLFLVQIKGRVKCGDMLLIHTDSQNLSFSAQVQECLDNGLRVVSFMHNEHILGLTQVLDMLEKYGHTPLPPYIKRHDTPQDAYFYQSVFGKKLGSIAAPTASLHFSQESIESIKTHFQTCFLTLHVGAGTFMGVESPDIRQHSIHKESFSLSPQSAVAIEQAHKVLCIGTTSARCVEYYARYKVLQGECDIFLYPSKAFKRVDYLLTNFHLPKSTLMMLVSAMIGREKCLEIYDIALNKGYKFYSYGDGMLIL
ncbi:tRNA preQ1(34) S-adenosylmethionine ribosyltransferase-isomerase QueA [Helicobacter sp. MIT 21-1697]|uniref:tRNA preQ1(34) S-adenosylmethionine ribosyltransferase-isomerase QueA n=1 Tax=Helicobacter sp. MIT 21-1697 TaxID=2993733 RepID=UPI00224B1157|nr:tRNA preQ1(34) S-adenosylmethionine ribosyltransferase-isomerase QueA [Helicobacter sp. MIT 21-1697]MCX2717496.1 tRNA preQ1(34) S-adenosylmethionine ribosyltransferase-isomerase QueA [Helicobacter sp. MIT 21-1697]